eukprot:12973385-Heterocapsa_arctica.AAC.1
MVTLRKLTLYLRGKCFGPTSVDNSKASARCIKASSAASSRGGCRGGGGSAGALSASASRP